MFNKSVFNGKIILAMARFILMSSLNSYIKLLKNIDILKDIDNKIGDNLQDNILAGREISLKNKISQLFISYINIMMNNKKFIDYSMEEIYNNTLKSKEKEKNQITNRLKNMNKEQRTVENLLKEHKLGDWNLGQTRALFQYDADQYDKERKQLEDTALMELKLGRRDDVTDMVKDIMMMDLQIEEEINRREAPLAGDRFIEPSQMLPEDDDVGDFDGDETFL